MRRVWVVAGRMDPDGTLSESIAKSCCQGYDNCFVACSGGDSERHGVAFLVDELGPGRYVICHDSVCSRDDAFFGLLS